MAWVRERDNTYKRIYWLNAGGCGNDASNIYGEVHGPNMYDIASMSPLLTDKWLWHVKASNFLGVTVSLVHGFSATPEAAMLDCDDARHRIREAL